MDYRAECSVTLAQLLELPDCAFTAHLALATDPAVVSSTVAGHVALFAERVVDLSLDERQELFVETFRSARADAERRCIVAALRQSALPQNSAGVEASLEYLRVTLLSERNPYAHLLVAIGGLLVNGGLA